MINSFGRYVLPESRELKLTKRKSFKPRTMGAFVLLIIVLAFVAGNIRRELVLTLIGSVFLVVWVYCLVMTLLLALLHSRRAGRISIRVIPGEIAVGDSVQAAYSEDDGMARNNRIFQFPGILVRCRLLLETKDNRRIRHDFAPIGEAGIFAKEMLEVNKRGAYFSGYDEFAIFDILGFFRFTFRIPQKPGVRLLVSPHAAFEPLPVSARSGESNRQPEITFHRTDILIEHRPYVPGDDPRRINWKLFSHGGELFIREGEREPPPHSNITILVDSQFDPMLYTAAAARLAVDLLCENALAAALACSSGGLNVQIGTNQTEFSIVIQNTVTPAQMAAALAWPCALPLSAASGQLSVTAEDRGILIFALPRASAEVSALDNFLTAHCGRNAGQSIVKSVELVFLYGCGEPDAPHVRQGELSATAESSAVAEAAETCAAMYNRRSGVRARAVGV